MADICPHLGLGEDRTVMRSQADVSHRCYATSPPGKPALEYQRDFCLVARHSTCPLFAPVEGAAAPGQAPVPPRRSVPRVLPWLLVAVALVAAFALLGHGLLPRSGAAPLGIGTFDTAAEALTPTPDPTLPASPATPPAAGAEPRNQGAGYTTPTPEPGGRVMVVAPRPRDVGWWTSVEQHGTLGDSFLYAGFYSSQAFVSAVRFELSSIPRGAPIRDATLLLSGLNAERFNPSQGGTWQVQLVADAVLENLRQRDFQEVYNAPAAATLFPALFPSDIGEQVTNALTLDLAAREWLAKQVLDNVEGVIVRITGPTAGDSMFAWDSGTGPASAGEPPRLVLNVGPLPPTPPPLPTEAVIVVTVTPTPANVLTVAADAATASALAAATTPTPLPYRMVTATPVPANLATAQVLGLSMGLPPIVISTLTPANAATARYNAEYATAVAMTTGTFTPVPINAVTPVIVMPTPIPQNVLTAAAQLRTATAAATLVGTMTPLPFNAVVATQTAEPFVLVVTPTPENIATVRAIAAYATAVAVTTGTFTPIPPGAVWATATRGPTNTPLPTVAPIVVYVDQITPTTVPTPPATQPPTSPRPIPADLRGKVIFKSDREGRERLLVYDPANRKLAFLVQESLYVVALSRDGLAPDGQRSSVVVEDGSRVPHVFVRDARRPTEQLLISPAGAASYDAAWSPADDRIAYVSEEAGNPEIYTVRADGTDLRRLTANSADFDRHPSWSPDGRQIVFASNRNSGRMQLWIMDADGSNQRTLLDTSYGEWDPVWVK